MIGLKHRLQGERQGVAKVKPEPGIIGMQLLRPNLAVPRHTIESFREVGPAGRATGCVGGRPLSQGDNPFCGWGVPREVPIRSDLDPGECGTFTDLHAPPFETGTYRPPKPYRWVTNGSAFLGLRGILCGNNRFKTKLGDYLRDAKVCCRHPRGFAPSKSCNHLQSIFGEQGSSFRAVGEGLRTVFCRLKIVFLGSSAQWDFSARESIHTLSRVGVSGPAYPTAWPLIPSVE